MFLLLLDTKKGNVIHLLTSSHLLGEKISLTGNIWYYVTNLWRSVIERFGESEMVALDIPEAFRTFVGELFTAEDLFTNYKT